jgi:hypothetical protein
MGAIKFFDFLEKVSYTIFAVYIRLCKQKVTYRTVNDKRS